LHPASAIDRREEHLHTDPGCSPWAALYTYREETWKETSQRITGWATRTRTQFDDVDKIEGRYREERWDVSFLIETRGCGATRCERAGFYLSSVYNTRSTLGDGIDRTRSEGDSWMCGLCRVAGYVMTLGKLMLSLRCSFPGLYVNPRNWSCTVSDSGVSSTCESCGFSPVNSPSKFATSRTDSCHSSQCPSASHMRTRRYAPHEA
jgi:hypothetical protein